MPKTWEITIFEDRDFGFDMECFKCNHNRSNSMMLYDMLGYGFEDESWKCVIQKHTDVRVHYIRLVIIDSQMHTCTYIHKSQCILLSHIYANTRVSFCAYKSGYHLLVNFILLQIFLILFLLCKYEFPMNRNIQYLKDFMQNPGVSGVSNL